MQSRKNIPASKSPGKKNIPTYSYCARQAHYTRTRRKVVVCQKQRDGPEAVGIEYGGVQREEDEDDMRYEGERGKNNGERSVQAEYKLLVLDIVFCWGAAQVVAVHVVET